jgi:hypothetical protein
LLDGVKGQVFVRGVEIGGVEIRIHGPGSPSFPPQMVAEDLLPLRHNGRLRLVRKASQPGDPPPTPYIYFLNLADNFSRRRINTLNRSISRILWFREAESA